MFGLKTWRRNRWRARPFPTAWLEFLRRNVPYYDRLTAPQQQELREDIQVFLAEKNFEGAEGMVLTDEIKVTIAAYACVLLLNRPHDFYPRLQTVLVYPDTFVAHVTRPYGAYSVFEGPEPRIGESWRTGAVVVSWNHVRRQPTDPAGARNVALHEFAHQLDGENGILDGTPALPQTSMYSAWARILGREYQTLRAATASHQPTLLDKYGATNPAEFFAVATEYFFEQPAALKQLHPELYDELRLYYRQDPAV